MDKDERLSVSDNTSPFERIRRTSAGGAEHWSSRDFAQVVGYSDYRDFAQVMQKARAACCNSGHRIEDHFVDITEMVGGQTVPGNFSVAGRIDELVGITQNQLETLRQPLNQQPPAQRVVVDCSQRIWRGPQQSRRIRESRASYDEV
jgi:hypothetical protein